MSVRIKDIAKRVNRSITTVSRALNGYDDVSPETKQLILETAKEMGYSPNTYAQRLQKQQSDTIGLILPTFSPRFSDPYFSELLAGIGNMAADMGFDLLVSTRSPGSEEYAAYEKLIEGRRVDGFIVVRTRKQDQRIDYLLAQDFPFVAFGRTDDCDRFSYVDEDGNYGMRLVAEYIAGLKHERIACLLPPEGLAFSEKRLAGLQAGLAEFGLALDPAYVKTGDLTQKSGYQLGRELLELPNRPTAIIACNDLMAFGVMSAAQDCGLVVGEDISITGFDDIPMSEYSHPPLTTVHQPVYQIGGMVCEMLVKIIREGITERQQVLLKPNLVIRQSCGLNK
ncbi:MAG: LacI family DNA-binding transcriptional regulator [Anaerolineaceae bacterium]|nr:LacI family DNA-binding transcriptional regulator [Anaerolineaceae bacterium]